VLKRFDMPFHKKYPNERVSLIKSPFRYIWKSFKANSICDNDGDEQKVVGALGPKNCDSVYQEFAGMRQRVDELTELIKQLKDLHTTQPQSRSKSILNFDSD